MYTYMYTPSNDHTSLSHTYRVIAGGGGWDYSREVGRKGLLPTFITVINVEGEHMFLKGIHLHV